MARKPKYFRQGDRVRIDAHLADHGADETGPQLELSNEPGRVIGANAQYRGHDGVERVTVQLDTGGIVSAPATAIRKQGGRKAVAFRMSDDAYTRCFGHPPRMPFLFDQ